MFCVQMTLSTAYLIDEIFKKIFQVLHPLSLWTYFWYRYHRYQTRRNMTKDSWYRIILTNCIWFLNVQRLDSNRSSKVTMKIPVVYCSKWIPNSFSAKILYLLYRSYYSDVNKFIISYHRYGSLTDNPNYIYSNYI